MEKICNPYETDFPCQIRQAVHFYIDKPTSATLKCPEI